MITIEERHSCSGCFACMEICPRSCITMIPDQEGFTYPHVEESRCTGCDLCVAICPIRNPDSRPHEPVGYACFHTEPPIRLASSSGGLFTAFAEVVLSQSGVVCGAGFAADLSIRHEFVEEISDLDRIRRSKYVQSSLETVFPAIASRLEEGRFVLFSGTPCQNAGLRAYLGGDHDNLLCIDLLCHGVPSPAVWKSYLHLREKQARSKVAKVSFRDKTSGWRTYSVTLTFEQGHSESHVHTDDPFMRLFISNTILRPSCHSCSFKDLSTRTSDISLGDLWGGKDVFEEEVKDLGTSLVILHTEKGNRFFSMIQDQISTSPIDLHRAITYNLAARMSFPENLNRERFFKDFVSADHEATVFRKYASRSSWRYLIGLAHLGIRMLPQYLRKTPVHEQRKKVQP